MPKRGRPRGKRPNRRVRFSETKLGRYMLVNAPFEYSIVVESTDPDTIKYSGLKKVIITIESIARMSDNPAFREPAFRIALIDFRRFGLRPRSRKRWSIKDAVQASQNMQTQITI